MSSSKREKAKRILEQLNILEVFEFTVDEFPYRKFYYDYDDLKIVNKSGYVKHYTTELERREQTPSLETVRALAELDRELGQETENWHLLHRAKIIFENHGKGEFLLSFNSLVDLGYSGYSGYYCAECWSTEHLRSTVKTNIFVELANIDRALGQDVTCILFDAVKFVVPFDILNGYFDWSTVQYDYANNDNISLFAALFVHYMHSLSIVKSTRDRIDRIILPYIETVYFHLIKHAQTHLTDEQLNAILEEPNCTGETLFAVASYTSLRVSLDIGIIPYVFFNQITALSFQ